MRTIALALALLLPVAANAYEFTINNLTSSKIVALEVSEDGASWGNFNVGAGLDAGASATATWSESTNDSNCEWQVRAKFADGSSSDAATFDFCEEELVVEFKD